MKKIIALAVVALMLVMLEPICRAGEQETGCFNSDSRAVKITFPYITWAYVSDIQAGSGFCAITTSDGSYIQTNSPVRVNIAGLALAMGLPLIIEWTSPTSYDVLYIGY